MALVYEQNWTSPTSNAKIYIDTSRSGEDIVALLYEPISYFHH